MMRTQTPNSIPKNQGNLYTRIRHRIFTVFAAIALLSAPGCEDSVPESYSGIEHRAALPSDDITNLDLSAKGPYDIITREYSLYPMVDGVVQGVIDPKVLDAYDENEVPIKTDVRGILYLPSPKNAAEPNGPYPLVVVLHGNTNSCMMRYASAPQEFIPTGNEFTQTGQCPADKEEMPSYLGFESTGEYLASHGYIVAAINANLGITGTGTLTVTPNPQTGEKDPELILARGRLVLRHLAFLRERHDNTSTDTGGIGTLLAGKIDFRSVGLMGHSRGGEGVRAAQYLYERRDPRSYASQLRNIAIDTDPSDGKHYGVTDMTIEGIFEFAPTHGFAFEPDASTDNALSLTAPGIHHVTVLGTCDEELTAYDGIAPFVERRVIDTTSGVFSGVVTVPGAVHKFFNSQWPYRVPKNCPLGQSRFWGLGTDQGMLVQQQIAQMTAGSFFRGFLGNKRNSQTYRKVFDAEYRLPSQLTELIDPSIVRESHWHRDMEIATMKAASSTTAGLDETETVAGFEINGKERTFRRVDWDTPDAIYEGALFQIPKSLSGFSRLSVSVARYARTENEIDPNLDVDIQLVYADGTASAPIQVSDYIPIGQTLNRPWVCRTNNIAPNNHCIYTSKEKSKVACEEDGGVYWSSNSGDLGTCYFYAPNPQKHFLIFNEVSIALEDFDMADGFEDGDVFEKPVSGLRFSFVGAESGRVIIDRTVVLKR